MYSYRCDVCGCYLDPGEGNLCDECQKAVDARRRNAERIDFSAKGKANSRKFVLGVKHNAS